MSSPGSRPCRNEPIVWREVHDEAYLLWDEGRTLRFLNPVGTVVWKLCDGTRTAEEIARSVTDAFDVTYETALADVLEFLGELSERRMISGW